MAKNERPIRPSNIRLTSDDRHGRHADRRVLLRYEGGKKACMEMMRAVGRLVPPSQGEERPGGRPIREVVVELFRRYVGLDDLGRGGPVSESQQQKDGTSAPEWFGVLRSSAQRAKRHDMEAIRQSIARGIAADRSL